MFLSVTVCLARNPAREGPNYRVVSANTIDGDPSSPTQCKTRGVASPRTHIGSCVSLLSGTSFGVHVTLTNTDSLPPLKASFGCTENALRVGSSHTNVVGSWLRLLTLTVLVTEKDSSSFGGKEKSISSALKSSAAGRTSAMTCDCYTKSG